MLQTIRNLLLKIVDDIDAGNSNIKETDALSIIECLKSYTDNNKLYNRTQAAKYLHCSVQSFDLYKKEGKLPKGVKESGGNMQWSRKQLDDFVSKYKIKNYDNKKENEHPNI